MQRTERPKRVLFDASSETQRVKRALARSILKELRQPSESEELTLGLEQRLGEAFRGVGEVWTEEQWSKKAFEALKKELHLVREVLSQG